MSLSTIGILDLVLLAISPAFYHNIHLTYTMQVQIGLKGIIRKTSMPYCMCTCIYVGFFTNSVLKTYNEHVLHVYYAHV